MRRTEDQEESSPGVITAGAAAWIRTALLDAGLVAGTLCVQDALGPTVGRGAHVANQAGAGLVPVHLAALRSGAAWRRHAGNVRPLRRHNNLIT